MSIIVGQHKLWIARIICVIASQCSRRLHARVCMSAHLPLHACGYWNYKWARVCTIAHSPLHAGGYWNYKWNLQGVAVCHATSAMWGVSLHGFAVCQATSAMGGVRLSAFVLFSHPPPRSKGASVNCKGLQWCTVGSVPLASPLVWGACCALRTSGVRDA